MKKTKENLVLIEEASDLRAISGQGAGTLMAPIITDAANIDTALQLGPR